MGGTCSFHGEMRNAHKVLVGKPEEKRTLRISRRWWEDNIKVELREIWFGGVDWTHLSQVVDKWRALINTVMNLPVP
jgi:hypothetical protein